MNDQLIVYANNVYLEYIVFLAPFSTSQLCIVNITDLGTNNIQCDFVYSVVTSKNQTTLPYFVYNCIDIQNRMMIGRIEFINNGTLCAYKHRNSLVGSNYSIQDNFVIGIDAQNEGVYAFTDDFIAYYDFQSWNMTVWPKTLPISPRAIDFTNDYGVLAGYCQDTPSQAFECAMIVFGSGSSSSPSHGSRFSIGSSLNFSWADLRSTHFVATARVYSITNLMSVSISTIANRVLIGIRALNVALLYVVDDPTTPNTIYPVSTRQTGMNRMGFGRSIVWLDNQGKKVAILANQYTYTTNEWISSAFHIYDIESDGFSDQTQPILIYPNSQQIVGPLINPSFIRLVSSRTSGHLGIFDTSGDASIILSAPPGFYPATDRPSYFSTSVPCIRGANRSYASIELCIPCENGTMSSLDGTSCEACSDPDMFCPYGAVAALPSTALESVEQEQDYPESPETTIFDDLLMQNMFSFNTKSLHCVLVSPITWVLLVIGFGSLILIAMAISTVICPGKHPVRDKAKAIFKKMDLIGEGELWIGGLVSAAVVVLVICAYSFSNAYFHQYPIESVVGESFFACDTSIRNAKFTTSMQMKKARQAKEIQPIFDLLEAQSFTLTIDLINTAFTCSDTLLVQRIISYAFINLSISSCTMHYNNSIVSLSILLPSHNMNMQVTLPGLRTVGAIRVGLTGPAATYEDRRYTLLALNVSSVFIPTSFNNVLAPSTEYTLQLSEIVNQTDPLNVNDLSKYSATWFATYDVRTDELFTQQNRYSFFQRSQTNLTITIEEDVYYVKNVQQPIARQTEVIFHNLLFTIVVLELFGLLFLVCKLLIVPLVRRIHERVHRYHAKNQVNTKENDDTNTESTVIPLQ
ncbi:unnamed protein product [Adineta steineri]|uniref:Uncharacterized protein n=1 Tax=Adineta steineri TaxID=433720 RepID=A0A813YS59_9BILA|nr:unnamed protein product [Adineta steineri]CAF0888240.1 unnamed protein product [Adineta steineri]